MVTPVFPDAKSAIIQQEEAVWNPACSRGGDDVDAQSSQSIQGWTNFIDAGNGEFSTGYEHILYDAVDVSTGGQSMLIMYKRVVGLPYG